MRMSLQVLGTGAHDVNGYGGQKNNAPPREITDSNLFSVVDRCIYSEPLAIP